MRTLRGSGLKTAETVAEVNWRGTLKGARQVYVPRTSHLPVGRTRPGRSSLKTAELVDEGSKEAR
jgi:hypothetical protein